MGEVMGDYILYGIMCKAPKHYYVGVTRNLESRLAAHMRGKGSAFTRRHGFVWVEVLGRYGTRGEAVRAEREAVLMVLGEHEDWVVAGLAGVGAVGCRDIEVLSPRRGIIGLPGSLRDRSTGVCKVRPFLSPRGVNSAYPLPAGS
jgi:predicted GIY-YIG superfamily endonuclease